jgi:hypothetical protein
MEEAGRDIIAEQNRRGWRYIIAEQMEEAGREKIAEQNGRGWERYSC